MKLIIDISKEAYNGIKMGMRNRDDMREVGEAIENGIPYETVTEFADRCRECGAKYGKLLKQEPCEDAISRQAVNTLVDELARAISDERCCMSRGRSTATIMQDILDLPPVKPQEPYKGMTNGEVIKAVFPNNPIDEFIHDVTIRDNLNVVGHFSEDWWNTSYKGEE